MIENLSELPSKRERKGFMIHVWTGQISEKLRITDGEFACVN